MEETNAAGDGEEEGASNDSFAYTDIVKSTLKAATLMCVRQAGKGGIWGWYIYTMRIL